MTRHTPPEKNTRANMQRFDRIMGLLLFLRGEQRTSAAVLARRFGVSTRTIHRDIDLLSALGVPVYAERGRGGGIRLLPGYFLPPVMFSTGEATSLILGLASLSSLRARPYQSETESARRKLLAALPDHLHALIANVDRAVGFEPAPVDTFHEERPEQRLAPVFSGSSEAEGRTVTVFLQALFDRQRVSLRYKSPYSREASSLLIVPGAAFWDRDRWYLVGERDGEAGGRRVWRADRVTYISSHGPAGSPADVDVRDLLAGVWLRPAMQRWSQEAPVTIEMSARQRDRLRRDWYFRHAAYDDLPNGRVRMTYGEDNQTLVFELLRWLGPEAELIVPVAWRANLREDLLRMAETHAT
ncbi:MAG TPA: WYL domain-containing protein [Thermomicrobiales bacterium]|nr:WYL domain-containing protein [Thermomicrobiales bacterium]